ncbi:MAG: hypothetical protein V3R81_09395 [Gammaproteobacteria bacterium]
MSPTGLRMNLDEFLTRANVAIANTRNTPDILAAVEMFGYDSAVMQQGQDLLDTARALSDAQQKEYGEQYSATAAMNEAMAEADRIYSDHRKLAEMVFKGSSGQQAEIGLNQSKKRSFSGWLTQAERFYANLLAKPDMMAAMDRFRVTQGKLKRAQALVAQVKVLGETQQREKGEAQTATKERDAALDALDEWLNEFKTVAKIALADNAQMLEALQFGVIP